MCISKVILVVKSYSKIKGKFFIHTTIVDSLIYVCYFGGKVILFNSILNANSIFLSFLKISIKVWKSFVKL